MINAGTPIRIGTRTAKNRITMAPTVKFYAGENGMVTDEFVAFYEERARHGCGLITVEATAIAPEARLHPAQLGLWRDEQIPGHRRIADAAHSHGALVMPQLSHGGLNTHPACGPMTSPTAMLWNDGDKTAPAKELTRDEIRRIIEDFIRAALRAQQAGYDGVQLHACHGYLINDFASQYNLRTDEYGGSTENLARFGCEVIRGIRQACGADFIISMRATGCEPTAEEAAGIARLYVEAGCDYLQISHGIDDPAQLPEDPALPCSNVAALGVHMKKALGGIVPVSAVGGLRTPEQVRAMIENEWVDTVDLGRGLLADPAFSEAILEGKPYTACYACPCCAYDPDHLHPCPAMLKRGADEFSLSRANK